MIWPHIRLALFSGMNTREWIKWMHLLVERHLGSWYTTSLREDSTSYSAKGMQHKAHYSNPSACNISVHPSLSVCIQAAVSFQPWRDGGGLAVPWSYTMRMLICGSNKCTCMRVSLEHSHCCNLGFEGYLRSLRRGVHTVRSENMLKSSLHIYEEPEVVLSLCCGAPCWIIVFVIYLQQTSCKPILLIDMSTCCE